MSSLEDVKRLAMKLPNVVRRMDGHTHADQWAASVDGKPKPKGFVWQWMERVDPKKARVPNKEVIAIRTASLADKDALLASDPDKFFTEPHYNGYAAVLVRLANVTVKELAVILEQAHAAVGTPPPARSRRSPAKTSGSKSPSATRRKPRR